MGYEHSLIVSARRRWILRREAPAGWVADLESGQGQECWHQAGGAVMGPGSRPLRIVNCE